MDEKSDYYKKMLWKFVAFAVIIFAIYLVFKTAVFYMPFVIAFIIASIAEPLIKFLTKKTKMRRKLASIISLIVIVAIIVMLLVFLISSLITESIELIENLNGDMTNIYNYGMGLINDFREGRIEIPEEVMQIAEKSYSSLLDGLKTFLGNFFKGLLNTITSIPTWFTYGFVTILAVIFICFDREYIKETCKKHIPSKWIEKVKMVFKETFSVAVEYIKAEAKLSFICFILVLIGLGIMNLIGIDIGYPIIMAIFIGVVDLLPLFGAGAVMLPWVGYLVVIGNTPAAIGVGVLWILWVIIKNLAEPKMISHQMGIHPIFTLIAMYTGFRIYGVLGLILGTIILIILKRIFAGLIEKGVLKTIFEQE